MGAQPEYKPSERDVVFAWRLEYLTDLGIDDADATSLALGTADLHAIEKAINAGAPLSLIAEIFV
jgi:hypothetical protein